MRCILLGKPGSGKGTQARGIVARLGIVSISTGDLIRQAVRTDAAKGEHFRAYFDRGHLVPDHLVLELLTERLHEPDCAQKFLLDGFPRTRAQAEALGVLLTKRRQTLTHALYIEVPNDILVERASGRRYCTGDGASYHVTLAPPRLEGRCDLCGSALQQRSDDVAEVVQARLREYQDKTAPLLGFYGTLGLLRQVDGLGTPAEVGGRIDAALQASAAPA